jgi:hypothetical protein
MWDTVESPTTQHLTRDMPCPHCGHATHTYLPCSDTCECVLPWLTTRPAPTTAAAASPPAPTPSFAPSLTTSLTASFAG